MIADIQERDPRGGEAKFLPTESEIKAMCKLIQMEWSPAEELRRRVIQPTGEMDYWRYHHVDGGE